jgi:hypothetical protein
MYNHLRRMLSKFRLLVLRPYYAFKNQREDKKKREKHIDNQVSAMLVDNVASAYDATIFLLDEESDSLDEIDRKATESAALSGVTLGVIVAAILSSLPHDALPWTLIAVVVSLCFLIISALSCTLVRKHSVIHYESIIDRQCISRHKAEYLRFIVAHGLKTASAIRVDQNNKGRLVTLSQLLWGVALVFIVAFTVGIS